MGPRFEVIAAAALLASGLVVAGCTGEQAEAASTPGAVSPGALTAQQVREIVQQEMAEALKRDAKDFRSERDRIAAHQTAAFIDAHMPRVQPFAGKQQLLSFSVSQVDPAVADGLWAEFGVYSGKTINHIAEQTDHVVHGFDSFEGLPEDWRTGFPKGTFDMDGLPVVRDNVRLHKGWFDASVPVWAAAHPGHMAFIHFDADLYSSTRTVLDLLGDRIVAGTVLQFDEFFNYPGWQQGEYRAFMEFVEARGVEFEYIGYRDEGNAEQVAVRITEVP